MDLIVHTVCFNEEAMLPHFLAYYAPQAKKVRIYDNQSTDRSVEIALSYPNVEVFSFDTGGKLSELTLMTIRNNSWKEASPVGRGALKVHRAEPVAHDLKLLHYKNLGLPYRLRRHQALGVRLGGEEFEKFRFGYHYSFPAHVQEAEFSSLKSRAVRVLE